MSNSPLIEQYAAICTKNAPDFSGINRMMIRGGNLLKKGSTRALYYFMPEDSEESAKNHMDLRADLSDIYIPGAVKACIWIAAAIIFSFAITHL